MMTFWSKWGYLKGGVFLFCVIGVLWWVPSLYAHFLINIAHIAHVEALHQLPSNVWEPEPYINLRDAYKHAAQIDPDWQQKTLYFLFPVFISQNMPSQTPFVCPGHLHEHLFLRLLKQANTLQQAQAFDRVDKLYTVLASVCPDSFELYRIWADYASGRRLYDLAITRLEKAVTLKPKMPPADYRQGDQKESKWSQIALARAYSDIGVQYHNKYQYAKAVEMLEASLTKYPPSTISPWLYNLIGVSAFEAGQYTKAKWAFEKVLEIAPHLGSEATSYLKRIGSKSHQ